METICVFKFVIAVLIVLRVESSNKLRLQRSKESPLKLVVGTIQDVRKAVVRGNLVSRKNKRVEIYRRSGTRRRCFADRRLRSKLHGGRIRRHDELRTDENWIVR